MAKERQAPRGQKGPPRPTQEGQGRSAQPPKISELCKLCSPAPSSRWGPSRRETQATNKTELNTHVPFKMASIPGCPTLGLGHTGAHLVGQAYRRHGIPMSSRRTKVARNPGGKDQPVSDEPFPQRPQRDHHPSMSKSISGSGSATRSMLGLRSTLGSASAPVSASGVDIGNLGIYVRHE